MTQHHPSMKDLYQRLAEAGFDRAFVREAVLPPWWEDELAATPANRELAELYVSHSLSLNLDALRDRETPLTVPTGNVRFKRSSRVNPDKTTAPTLIARRIGEILIAAIPDLPAFNPMRWHPEYVRRWLFHHGYNQVDLESLTAFCSDQGIVLFHLDSKALPRNAHQIDGMAMFCGPHPVIMLGSSRKHPAWLAFHLAHEIAHILRKHVTPESGPLVDSDLASSPGHDAQENEANRWGLAILTMDEEPEIGIPPEAKFVKLTHASEKLGKEFGVDPGVVALIHAQRHNAWPIATRVLNVDPPRSVRAIINEPLRQRIDLERLPDASAHFLSAVLFS